MPAARRARAITVSKVNGAGTFCAAAGAARSGSRLPRKPARAAWRRLRRSIVFLGGKGRGLRDGVDLRCGRAGVKGLAVAAARRRTVVAVRGFLDEADRPPPDRGGAIGGVVPAKA